MYKKFLLISILLIGLSAFAKEEDTVLSFDTEQEYIDFIYSLNPVLAMHHPKSTVNWVMRNSSQYETDLNNVVLLANADFKKNINKKFVKVSQGERLMDIIEKGNILFGKRKSASGDQAIWIVIIGYDNKGVNLYINDSKTGPAQKIPTDSLGSAYYLK